MLCFALNSYQAIKLNQPFRFKQHGQSQGQHHCTADQFQPAPGLLGEFMTSQGDNGYGHHQGIVTELPYQVNKARFQEHIAEQIGRAHV